MAWWRVTNLSKSIATCCFSNPVKLRQYKRRFNEVDRSDGDPKLSMRRNSLVEIPLSFGSLSFRDW